MVNSRLDKAPSVAMRESLGEEHCGENIQVHSRRIVQSDSVHVGVGQVTATGDG